MVEELTNSLYQTEGVLAMAQAMNESMQNAVNGLRSKNESLKLHYSMSCASYNSIFSDLNRAKGLEANLSRKVSVLEREKSALRRDLDWVMKKSLPRILARLRRQKARELLMANQRLPDYDPNLPRKVKDIVRGLKRTRWECMESLISSSDLSLSLLCSVLECGDSGAGEGSSS
ncbi:hypothetical protein Tco_0846181 [Tanacetum coccineum]